MLSNSARSVNEFGFHLLDDRLQVNAPDDREEMVLSPAVLQRYVGAYQLGPGVTVTVTESPHGLTAQATGIGIAPLHPESETEFSMQPINARVTFEHDAAGAVTGLIFHHGDRHSRAQKIA